MYVIKGNIPNGMIDFALDGENDRGANGGKEYFAGALRQMLLSKVVKSSRNLTPDAQVISGKSGAIFRQSIV